MMNSIEEHRRRHRRILGPWFATPAGAVRRVTPSSLHFVSVRFYVTVPAGIRPGQEFPVITKALK